MESEYCEGEDQENGDPGCDHDGLGGVDQPNLHKHHNTVYLFTVYSVITRTHHTQGDTLAHCEEQQQDVVERCGPEEVVHSRLSNLAPNVR